MSTPCLDDGRVKAFVSASLSDDARREVEDHVDDCPDCRKLLVALVRTTPPATAEWRQGHRVGRYVVGASVGRGAMGEVFRAEDVELARPVALKRLHAGPGAVIDAHARGRLVREARAAAQLQHPNVVAVYEIVDDGERAVLATEWIDGVTLREWLATRARPWREVVQVVAAAGRGLAAAHAAGIIHRDFKPENVLVDRAGRARVADFGLASHVATVEAANLRDQTQVFATATGTIAGTPAYMAPELIDGARPDPRSDQFAFAVTLFEAVHGRYPFAGATAEAIWAAMAAGAIQRGDRRVPAWLDRALRRALSADPAKRFPDLATLLDLLERKSRRGPGVPIAVAGALGGIAVAALAMALRGETPPPCGDDLVDGVWTASARTELAKQFAAVAPVRSDAALAFMDRALDQWTGAWRLGRRAACAAEPAARRSRTSCLDRQLGALRAQIGVWTKADAAVVDRAWAATSLLPSPDECTSATETMTSTALAEPIANIEAMRRAGRFAEARSQIPALVEAANAADPTSKSRALIAVAGIEYELRDHAAARTHLAAAEQAARQAGDDVLLANALILDASVRTVEHNPAEALGLCDAVAALGPSDDVVAKLESARGDALRDLHRGEESVAAFRRSIAILEKIVARDPSKKLMLAANIGALGSALRLVDQYPEGIAELKRALAIEEPLLGPNHPEVARTLHDMASLQRESGEVEEATRNYHRVRTIFVAAFGEGALEVAETDAALADIAIAAGELDKGFALASQARDEYVKSNASPGLLSSIETALGNIEQNRDKCAAAIPHYEAALAAAKEAKQTGYDLAISYANLAACLVDVGHRDAEARNALEGSLAAWKASGDSAPERAQSLAVYADLEAHGHRYAHAIELGEQALAAIKGLEGEPWQAIRDHVNDSLAIWRPRAK